MHTVTPVVMQHRSLFRSRYMKRTPESEFPPHVFTIAHDAYYGVTAFQELQSIIISGESGATIHFREPRPSHHDPRTQEHDSVSRVPSCQSSLRQHTAVAGGLGGGLWE
mmetsp:Transcript_10798/g.27801  ORF Transcript_10798/g.27801 Transcript_10798/m.27801 type:complete len:109 (+) Transcript_10798:81-407(+)